MPRPALHEQFVPGIVKKGKTNCVCSGAHCAAVGGFAALRMRRAPLRVVSALYRNIQSRKGAGAPPHHPDVSFRGAKRRGNLLQPVTFSPRPTCYPIWYCEIATAPLGPRNDNLGVLAILATAGTSRSCSAGRGMPRPYNGGYGRRSSRKFATAIGAQYPQGARRIRKAAKPPTAAQ